MNNGILTDNTLVPSGQGLPALAAESVVSGSAHVRPEEEP